MFILSPFSGLKLFTQFTLPCQVIFYPLRYAVWLEPPAFQEKLVKPPTFHNFTDPILHNIVIKDIFAWVYLVSTEQITNRVSLEIGYNSSEMDRDQYSGNCLFNIEADKGEEEEVHGGGGGHPTQLPLRYPERHFALVGMYARRSLKNERKIKLYNSQKLRLVTLEFLIPPNLRKILNSLYPFMLRVVKAVRFFSGYYGILSGYFLS